MLSAGNGTIAVTSPAMEFTEFAEPSLDTAAISVTVEGALLATFTVSLRAGKLAPAASVSLRVHGPAGCVQLHPGPPIPVAVRLAGSVSVTVTAPLVAPDPLLDAVRV